jgi:hypothetical protein
VTIRTISKSRPATGVIPPYRIVKPGANPGEVALATAAADALIGTTGQLGAKAAGDRVDVDLASIPEVELGGTVAAGDPLTANADGKAIKAEPAAGANVRIIGFADTAGTAAAIINYIYAPGVMQG